MADAVENMKDTIAEKMPVSTAELVMANTCLAAMALVPVIIGSFRSLKRSSDDGSKGIIDMKEALKMPVMLSGVLCILYWNATWKKKSQEENQPVHSLKWFNVLRYFDLFKVLKLYIMYVSVLEFYDFVKPCLNYYISLSFCACVGGINCFLSKSLWLTNNLLGIALSANMIACVHLNTARTGCVLLGGLLVCDVFMVFGTDIMATVANEMDVPIQLIFPADILTNGISADRFTMIGLGDIVVPGFFIAFLARFDIFRNHKALYFSASLFGYAIGLTIAFTIAQISQHGQPALLYLSPLTIAVPLLVAYTKGDLSALFAYEEVALTVVGTEQVIVVPADEVGRLTGAGTSNDEETDDEKLSGGEMSDDAEADEKEGKKDK